MSRHAIGNIAYGYDHACGYFYQEYDVNGECIADIDTRFDGLTGAQLAEKLEKILPANHPDITFAYLDMPI